MLNTTTKKLKSAQELFLEHLEEVKLTGDVKKIYFSQWSVTINTNFKFNDLEGLAVKHSLEQLEHAYENLLNHIDSFIIFLPKGDEWSPDVVKQASVAYRSELGPTTGSPHLHSNILIKHYSAIQLDYKAMREFIIKELNVKNIFMKVTPVRGSKHVLNLERYLVKTDTQAILDLSTESNIGELDEVGVPVSRVYTRHSRLIKGETEKVFNSDKEYFDYINKKPTKEKSTIELLREYMRAKAPMTGLRAFLEKQINRFK